MSADLHTAQSRARAREPVHYSTEHNSLCYKHAAISVTYRLRFQKGFKTGSDRGGWARIDPPPRGGRVLVGWAGNYGHARAKQCLSLKNFVK